MVHRKSTTLRLTAFLLYTLATAVSAQYPAGPPQSAPDSGITLKVTTKLTVEDVTVTDAQGQPVHGLTQADFTMKEDGKPQPIKNFQEYGKDRPAPQPSPQPAQSAPHPLPPDIYTNSQPVAPATGAANFLMLDALNTAPQLQAVAQQQAVKYLNDLPPGTQIAILQLGTSGVRIVQGLTTDRAILVAAMESPVPDPSGAVRIGGSMHGGLGELCNILNTRSRTTTGALDAIAAFMSGIKGRKNLIWFTTGLPQITSYGLLHSQIAFSPSHLPDLNPNLYPEAPDLEDHTADLQKSYALLTAAQVAIYPVDPRGLQNCSAISGDYKIAYVGGGSTKTFSCVPPDDPDPVEVNNGDYQLLEHASMEDMAAATGGKAFYNRNDLDAAIGVAIATGTDYYSLSYVPPLAKYDGKYHKIQVKVDRPGLRLQYREGYTAVDIAGAEKVLADNTAAKAAPPPASEFHAAMEHGVLPSSDLQFGVRITPSTEPTKPGDPVAGLLNPALKGKPLERYELVFVVPASQITLNDGHGSLDLAATVYGDDGTKLNVLRETLNFTLKGRGASRYFQGVLHLDLPPGKLFVRAGVQDLHSQKMGTLEIPEIIAVR